MNVQTGAKHKYTVLYSEFLYTHIDTRIRYLLTLMKKIIFTRNFSFEIMMRKMSEVLNVSDLPF